MRPPTARGRRRDDEAFALWVDTHGDQLLRTAYLFTGDGDRAQDLVQSVLLKALPKWPQIASLDNPLGYLRRALLNERTDRWRRHGSRERLAAEPPDSTAADHAAAVALRRDLLQALQLLAPGQRAAVVLRFFDDLPDDEVALILGCTVGTVRSQISRALVRLRPHMTNYSTAANEGCLQ